MENTKILKNIFIFRGLSQIQLAQFNKVLVHQSVSAGDRLIEEGAHPDRFYVVLEGSFLVTKEWDHGRETLAQLGSGEHFGEIGLIDHGPRSASVEAETDGAVCYLERQAFEKILDEFPEARLKIYENFLESLCERLRSSNENLLVAAKTPDD